MQNKILKILTSYKTPQKTCAIGNEAVARGAIEIGINGVFSYPGTPSTEISEIFNHINIFQNDPSNKNKYPKLISNPLYFEYSINEKIALEKAIAYSIGNKSAMCVMKNVGMNVASDPLMTISYQTIGAPLVIVICDDPGCHSSSNEQDSRYWAKMASVPLFNPATPEDAYSMTKDAFNLSDQLKLPVIVRMTTRVSHTRGMLSYSKIVSDKKYGKFEKIPEHINIPARTAAAHQRLLDKLHSNTINPFSKKHNIQLSKNSKTSEKKKASSTKLGVISSGVASTYLFEILHKNRLEGEIDVLKLGLISPFPSDSVFSFIKNVSRILILEELDPLIENDVRVIAQKNNVDCKIVGKDFSTLATTGEYSLDIVTKALEEFIEKPLKQNKRLSLDDTAKYLANLPPRPPALCSGCPHRATFYALKLAIPRKIVGSQQSAVSSRQSAVGKDDSNIILCGDIGCFGLGALPPLQMIDTIHHMGMSISMAQGLSEALLQVNGTKTIAMIGDGTFFHSGIVSLLNAIYTKSNFLLIIFDNRTIGMTGGQDHPGSSQQVSKYSEIDLPTLLKGMGIQYVEEIDPFDIKGSYNKINDALTADGVSVIVSKSPCIFHPDHKPDIPHNATITIDHTLCNTCHNHRDKFIPCSRISPPESNLIRAKAKIGAEHAISGDLQQCPANICNHGFFFSILEGNYKEAIEIVRDKMLFARTCGDICHRPCELFANVTQLENCEQVVPIKQLKKFVSAFDDNFKDFSVAINRVHAAKKKNKHIAVIGGGPAGLSAAYDLIQTGYDVTIYEKEKEAGGLIKYAIPVFRMDKNGFDFEISQLAEMGVNFKFNTVLGNDISLEKLSNKYNGVVLAIGMGKSQTLDVVDKNIPKEKRFDAISFLKKYNLNTIDIEPASSILLIGGGNSAIDAARAAKKLNAKNTILVSCIESAKEMPAFSEEIEHAVKEGIHFMYESFVEKCSADADGKINFELSSLKTKKHLKSLKCDYVIVAIGQKGDKTLYPEIDITQFDDDVRIKADREGKFTEFENVFIAGDVCAGNHISVIGAIASGKRAATGIRRMLEDYPFPYEGLKALENLNLSSHVPPPSQKKENGDLIGKLKCFDLFQACEKCNHCIDNFGCPALIKVDGKIVIDYDKCTRCGLCIDVCPNNAIQWTEQEELEI